MNYKTGIPYTFFVKNRSIEPPVNRQRMLPGQFSYLRPTYSVCPFVGFSVYPLFRLSVYLLIPPGISSRKSLHDTRGWWRLSLGCRWWLVD